MKRKQWIQRTAAAALCLLLCLCSMRTAASASEAYPYPTIIDRESLCSLTLDFGYPNVTVRAYLVAEVSQDVRFTLTGEFTGYPVSLDGLTSAGWAALAQTLRGYVFLDGVRPVRTAVSDETGHVTFTDLPIGLYLVEGERVGTVEEGYRQPAPFLICLPNWEEISNSETGASAAGWVYDVSARPKYTTLDGDVIMRRVLKVWDDDGNAASRPARITVALLKDGEAYDTVDLNAENNWRHSWDELDGGADWQIVETDGGGNYTVSASLQGVTFVVTNSYSPPPPPDDPPPEDPPDDPPPENPPDDPPPENPPDDPPPENPPDNPENPPSVPPPPDEEIDEPPVPTSHLETPDPDPENPVRNPEENPEEDLDDPDIPLASLPQTGQLWWPVPLLAMGGMMMLLLGLIFCKRSRGDEA